MKIITLCSLCKGDGQINNEISQDYTMCPVCGGTGIEETEVKAKIKQDTNDDNDKNTTK